MLSPLTLAEIRQLPAAVDLITAARAFHLGPSATYALARRGAFPVPVHRYGRAYRIHTVDILSALEIPVATAPTEPSTDAQEAQ
ncbi:DNA-binding protein [Frankia sp. AgB1.9]|uniref:DNA-binding protein n=1 Tax=unclassified Frankia TaxID=2632575 RepID=UPI0019318A4C|nr:MULTISPECIES: DNA-binding protein [unclassified Frankia]MBL7487894.1 DNA-binding protein [Frankia sp. AgW1.1]MBL7549959.1 DNA-binding protein [Frankia sp. AgB1.9]MBL7621462.1 DNA-binding protein [Frankia sp. AgB1.8]